MINIIGIVGLIILIYLTVIWIIGVRTQLTSGIPVITGSLVFTCLTLSIFVLNIEYIYSWIFIAIGYISVFTVNKIYLNKIRILIPIVRNTSSIYASIIRIGIPEDLIKDATTKEINKIIDTALDKK